jgi:hypothetical protein
MQAIDRTFGCLLLLGGIGHVFGSWPAQPVARLWAEAAAFAIFLLAAIDLLRTARPTDRALAWISLCRLPHLLWFLLMAGRLSG